MAAATSLARLPISAHAGEIVDAFEKHQVVIIAGQTGCGKTTRVPRYLYEAQICSKGKLIGVTEPRRIAAVSVASFVAQEMNVPISGLVGYQIRHENRTSSETQIKYMTEGVLLRESLADPKLSKYDCLVLDEVHERGFNQDVIMALVKDILPDRPDLKVAIMSATIDEEKFAAYFDGAPIIRVEGRTYPVEIEYAEAPAIDYCGAAAQKVHELESRTTGDILVFLPDYESIRHTAEALTELRTGLEVFLLYGNQTPEEQMAVFNRTRQSVILATNVAETSITVDGVTAVVDTGLVKQYCFRPGMGMSTLHVVEHSQAGCEQRAGRAGRTQPGLCCRLFTNDNFLSRPNFTEPEIKRIALEQVLLQFKAMGFTDKEIYRFDFLDPPKRDAWRHADRALRMLGAIDDHCQLTSTGELMAEIPLAPQITRMLIAAKRLGCVDQTVTIAASFAARPVFIRPIGEEDAADEAHEPWQDTTSDFATLLKVIDVWRRSSKEEKGAFCELNYLHPRALQEIDDVAREIKAILTDFGWHITSCRKLDTIGQAVMSGLAANLLINSGRGYRLISKGEPERQKHHGHDDEKRGKRDREPHPDTGRAIRIHPGSSLAHGRWPEFIVAAEIQETTQIWARRVQAVEEGWLKLLPNEVRNLIPHRNKHKGDKHCHDKSKRHHDRDRDRGRGRHR